MKKDKTIWIVGIIVLGLILYNMNPGLFTVFTPKTQDVLLNSYVNKFYFPINEKNTNTEACSVPSVTIGSSFAADIKTVPTSGNYLFYKNQYYKVNKVSNAKGSCSNLGQQIIIHGQAPFQNLLLIEKGSNLLLCQNLDGNKYKYTQFAPVKVSSINKYYIKYSIPEIEPDGKYYCDSKSKTIYFTPCGAKQKEVVEVCELGCEVATKTLDTADIEVVKCKGDFKPNQNVCSSNGKNLFKSDANGILTTESCCSCKEGVCSKTVGCAVETSQCQLLKGDGKNQINVYLVDYKYNKNYSDWIMEYLPKQVPYNEFTFNFYSENRPYACRALMKESSRDVRIAWDSVCGSYAFACAEPTSDLNKAGYLSFSVPKYASITKNFLLLHELGHVYLHYGHTCDGSIMDYNGGKVNRTFYQPYQADIVRKNLQGPGITRVPSGFGSGTVCGGRR